MVYNIPESVMEWLQESYDEEYDFDHGTEITRSLYTILEWSTNQNYKVPIDSINCVLIYYREDAYGDWVKSHRPRELTIPVIALEYLHDIINNVVPDIYGPDLYYPNSPAPDFHPPATVREFLEARVLQLGLAQCYETEVLRAGLQYTTIRTIARRGPISWCFNNAAYMTQKHNLTYVEGFALEGGFVWPMHHAWNIDKHGRVIDITWGSRGVDYYGVANPTRSIVDYK